MAIDDTHRSIDRCRSHVCHHPPCGQRPTRPAPERSPIDRPSIAHRSHIDRTSIAHRSPIDRTSDVARAQVVPDHDWWCHPPSPRARNVLVGRPVPTTTKTRRPTTTTTTTTTTRSVPHPLVHGGDDDDGGRPTTLCDDDDRGRHDAYISVYDDHTYTYTDRYGHATHAKGQRPFVRGGFDLISNHAHDAGWGGLIAPRVGVFYT